MSYNGSGTFAINSTGQPVVAGTVISSTVFNSLTADLGTGLSTAITKDGQTTTTARILFAAGISSTLATDATSISTGSILTLGGLGVTKAAWIGGLMNVAGAATFQSTIGITGALNATTINASGLVAMAAAATVGTTLAVSGTSTMAAINASGNIGAKATVSASWWGNMGVVQAGGATTSIFAGNSVNTNVVANALYNGTNWVYINNGLASQYEQTAGAHNFYSVATGTAGNNTAGGPSGANFATPSMSISALGAVTISGTLGVTGIISTGTASVVNAATSEIVLPNNLYLRGATAANTNTIPLIKVNSSNGITIGTVSGADVVTTSGQFRTEYAWANTGGTTTVMVDSNGSLFKLASARKYKMDFAPYSKGLADVLKLDPQYYRIKSQGEDSHIYAGLIADDLDAQGLSEFVAYGPEGVDSINYGHMAALFANAIKELAADFQSYKNSHP